MDKEVPAGSSTSAFGQLALGISLLAFGLGNTGVIDGVTAAGSVSLATYVGGVALFIAGLFALRERDVLTGTAFALLGALWFTWGVSADQRMPSGAAGLFLLLFALVALTLTAGSGGAPLLTRALYVLLFLAFVLLALGQFRGSGWLTQAGGWFAVADGALAWYAGTAVLAHWPTALPAHAGGRGVTVTG
ncbi:GPR1/FUN34/YaaH family transporter [Streptomyces sp. NPDC059785]|uniref:GPR1/FUN34/YaaH family transporter n=1 Tax=unclassified Streptomyces TaxID=2593676 RepID=UPI0036641E56